MRTVQFIISVVSLPSHFKRVCSCKSFNVNYSQNVCGVLALCVKANSLLAFMSLWFLKSKRFFVRVKYFLGICNLLHTSYTMNYNLYRECERLQDLCISMELQYKWPKQDWNYMGHVTIVIVYAEMLLSNTTIWFVLCIFVFTDNIVRNACL